MMGILNRGDHHCMGGRNKWIGWVHIKLLCAAVIASMRYSAERCKGQAFFSSFLCLFILEEVTLLNGDDADGQRAR